MKADGLEVADRLLGSPLNSPSVAEEREHLVKGWRSARLDSVHPSLQ